MKDELFDRYEKCPNCGKDKGLYYSFQIPLEINQNLDGTYCYFRNGQKRKMSNKEMLRIVRVAMNSAEYQMAICCCSLCGWQGETMVP